MAIHIRRRDFITLLGGAAAAWPPAVCAQVQPKMLRVGFVGMLPRESPLYANFLKRMAELGYQEGRNFTFDYIQTPNIEGYEKNYRELATRKVDVFLAVGNEPALRAALSVADGKPIAFLAIDFDPLAKGYVANLSHPGGNVTGIFVREIELAAKRVEIAREAFPRATLVGIAFDTLTHEQGDAAADAARKWACSRTWSKSKGSRATRAHLARWTTMPAGSRSFCPQAGDSCATARPSRKHCSSAAFRRSQHSGRTWRPAR
jgi:ABC transporter substrate binding protein